MNTDPRSTTSIDPAESEIDHKMAAAEGARSPGREWLMALGAALLITLLMVIDIQLLRTYLNLDLPRWMLEIEPLLRHELNISLMVLSVVICAFRGRQFAFNALATIAMTALIGFGFKFAIGRVRPSDAADAFLFFPFNLSHDSYPSGHTGASFAAAVALTRAWPRLGWIWIVAASAVAWGRFHTYAHFASDIAAGIILAGAVERLSAVMFIKTPTPHRFHARFVLAPALAILLPLALTYAWRVRTPPLPDRESRGLVVRALYDRIMNRPVDESAFDLWVDDLLPKVRIFSDPLFQFVRSDEFHRSITREPIPQQIPEVYRRLLNREPLAGEIERAHRSMKSEELSRYDLWLLTSRLVFSPEYRANIGPFQIPGDPRRKDSTPSRDPPEENEG